MKPPSPEKLLKQQQLALLTLCNRIASAFSYRKIKTWADVYEMSGTPDNAKSGAVTYPELKVYFTELKEQQKAAQERKTTAEDNSGRQEQEIRDVVDVVIAQHAEAQLPVEKNIVPNFDSKNYGLPLNKNHKAFLFWFQKKAVVEILTGFLGFDVTQAHDIEELRSLYHLNKHRVSVKRGLLLLAATGTGKTFIFGAVVRYLFDIGFHSDKTFGCSPYLIVTRATIVEQTKRVFENVFLLSMKDGVEIINIEQLRSRAGALWVKATPIIVNGNEQTEWSWRAPISPCCIFWDESQALNNEGTQQHDIAAAYNNIPNNTFQLHISATPFTTISRAKCFCVSTRKNIQDKIGTGHITLLNNNNWPTFASSVAYPADISEHNEAAIERLVKEMDSYIVRVRGVRSQFDAKNRVEMISFETQEERDYYNEAWERYLAEIAKLAAAGISKNGATGNSRFLRLVQLLKFRMAAEFCRRHVIARKMFEATQQGKAAVSALNFKQTMIAVVKILHEKYGVQRDSISLVWGGGQTALTAKQKMKATIKAKAEALEAAGLDATELLKDMALDEVEDRVLEELPEHLRLGSQSKEERQKEIDRFQSGKSLFCLYTFRAGGVGLSLHHTDEYTKEKVRHKESGYAVEEDISRIPIRPRINFVAPTYSAIELVQGLGRCPRLTSLSDTEQVLLFYRGTIEEEVARVVGQKLRCLSKVVRQHESWQDIVAENGKADSHLSDEIIEEVSTNYDDLTATEEEEEV